MSFPAEDTGSVFMDAIKEYDLRGARGRRRVLLNTPVPFTARHRPTRRQHEGLRAMVKSLEKHNLLEEHDRKMRAKESLGKAIGSALASAFILWRIYRKEQRREHD